MHLEQLGRGYDYLLDAASRYLLLLALVLLLPFGYGPAQGRWLLVALFGGYGPSWSIRAAIPIRATSWP